MCLAGAVFHQGGVCVLGPLAAATRPPDSRRGLGRAALQLAPV
jgi:hypothetical protein